MLQQHYLVFNEEETIANTQKLGGFGDIEHQKQKLSDLGFVPFVHVE